MCVLNQIDRFNLVKDVVDRVPGLADRSAYVRQSIDEKLINHRHFIRKYGEDMPEIGGWVWPAKGSKDSGKGPEVSQDTAGDNV